MDEHNGVRSKKRVILGYIFVRTLLHNKNWDFFPLSYEHLCNI